MTVFLTIFFVIMLIGRIAAGYFSAKVPFLGKICTALTWVTVIVGILALAFIIAELIKKFRGKKD